MVIKKQMIIWSLVEIYDNNLINELLKNGN
jgi:hypothetical protein